MPFRDNCIYFMKLEWNLQRMTILIEIRKYWMAIDQLCNWKRPDTEKMGKKRTQALETMWMWVCWCWSSTRVFESDVKVSCLPSVFRADKTAPFNRDARLTKSFHRGMRDFHETNIIFFFHYFFRNILYCWSNDKKNSQISRNVLQECQI